MPTPFRSLDDVVQRTRHLANSLADNPTRDALIAEERRDGREMLIAFAIIFAVFGLAILLALSMLK